MLPSALLLLIGLCSGAAVADSSVARSLNVHYAYENGRAFNYSDPDLLAHWDQVQPSITMMTPFFLNQADVSKYSNMTAALANRKITLVPAVGGPVTGGNPSDGDINSPKFLKIARGYRNISDSIRLEELQGYHEHYGDNGIRAMIEHCIKLGFTQIHLSPWPMISHNEPVPLNYSQIAAAHHSVYVDGPGTKVKTNPKNWTPTSQTQIEAIINYVKTTKNPVFNSFIGYQNIQQKILSNYKGQPDASIANLSTTIQSIQAKPYAADNLHWIAPFTPSYDPIELGSWKWIAGKLSKM